MTDKVKQLAPQIWEEIQKAKRILLCCHVGPDGDSYGANLALWHVLKNQSKEVTLISGDSPFRKQFSSLPGFNLIKEKSFLDINQKDFDLFLALDSSSIDQISKSDKISLDPDLNVVVIDHHTSNTNFGRINLVDSSYPAVSQMLYDLFVIWNMEITPEVAICLFVGIYTDTGGFKYAPVSPETLKIAANLSEKCPDFSKTILEIENNRTPKELAFEAIALSSIKTYFSGKVAISGVPKSRLVEAGIGDEETHTSGISSNLVSVTNWEIGICFTEKIKDEMSVSFRTRGKYDVAKIAVATGSGGGHVAAAGARLKMPFEKATDFLLETVKKVYPELGNP